MLTPETQTAEDQIRTAIRTVQEAFRAAHRTWLVPPHLVDQANKVVEQHQMGHLVDVQPSTLVPADQIYVLKTSLEIGARSAQG